MKRWAALWLLALLAVPLAAAGQGIGARVSEVRDGVARMSFASRPGVEICENGIHLFRDREEARGPAGAREGRCAPGPVVVEVRVQGGEVRDVHLLDAGHPRAPRARDLGVVPAAEAARFLLDAARRAREGRGLADAILPVMMADVDGAWRMVLAVAEDAGAPNDVRRAALFWVGQEAAEAATAGLAGVASDEGEDAEVRAAAVFALSQRPPGEGIPVLMDLARTARDARTRKAAFFWLANARDERVIPFFRAVLLGARGG